LWLSLAADVICFEMLIGKGDENSVLDKKKKESLIHIKSNLKIK